MNANWYEKLTISKFLVLSLVVFSSAVYAAVDIPGSRDLDNFQRFPLSNIISFDESTAPQYSLALGKIKKANGVAFPEEQRFLTGVLSKVTYQIPSGHNTREVSQYVSEQLQKLQAKTLFECKARGCGSSNDWANRQFNQATLYGLTGEQFYWAVELESGQYLAIYLTQRGNRKVYLHLESLQTESNGAALTKEQMLERWSKGERVYVSSGDIDAEQLDVLIAASSQILAERPFSKLWVVGHEGGENPFLILLDSSEQAAFGLRKKLLDAGLPENRIEYRGVGPLAPTYGEVPDSRIELLVE